MVVQLRGNCPRGVRLAACEVCKQAEGLAVQQSTQVQLGALSVDGGAQLGTWGLQLQ